MNEQFRVDELIVYDAEEACPYLPGQTARMPLRMPTSPVSRRETDDRLEAGERRSGSFVYRTHCPRCRACEPIRIPVREFTPSRSQRRTWKKCQNQIRVEIGDARVDDQRVKMFNKHRNVRGLCHDNLQVDSIGLGAFLVDSCFDTFEFRFYLADNLIACSVCDVGEQSMSAVYCYYDPDHSKFGLGTFAILTQIDYCLENGFDFLYLGFFVAESEHMSYKSAFRPHERKVDGKWVKFT